MIGRLVAWSARCHWVVIISTLILAVAGDFARRALAGDVMPDLSDPQIGVIAEWPGHSAPDVAHAVTGVLMGALDGLDGCRTLRGTSMSGMAYVDVVLESGASLDTVRQSVLRRVNSAGVALPAEVHPRVGPTASSTGWVFQYALLDPTHATSFQLLTRVQDEILGPALKSVPGVAEVASVGGAANQVVVTMNRERLRERTVAVTDVISALRGALAPSTRPRDANPRQTRLCEQCDQDLLGVPIAPAAPGTEATRLGDVAAARIVDYEPPGLADLGGERAVGGIVIARRDADVAALVRQVKLAIDREHRRFSRDVQVVTVYDRSVLSNRTHRTLAAALAEEVSVVALVIFVFLLHPRSALVPLVTLPAVLVLTFAGMWIFGVSATIMSLGGIGIALGLAVDADVVALEASHRWLEGQDGVGPPGSEEERRTRIRGASLRFAPAIVTSLLIAAASFLPIFVFTGETGRLLRPMAITKTLVIASAVIVSLTLSPALRDRVMRGKIIPEYANPLTRSLVRLYRPFVTFALARPAFTLATAVLAVVSCIPIALRLGGEFLPRVDEGDLLFMPTARPGIRAAESAAALARQDRALARFGEVAAVFGKVGRADTATDPAPYSMAETIVGLRPRSEWPIESDWQCAPWVPGWLRRSALALRWLPCSPDVGKLVDRLDAAVRSAGWTNAWTAPARARMDMMSTGIRTPLGIRLIAGDSTRLERLTEKVADIAKQVPGAQSVQTESLGDEAWLSFETDAARVARFQVNADVVRQAADLFANGGQVGEVERRGERVPVRLAFDTHGQGERPADALGSVSVRGRPSPGNTAGELVPLDLLGRPTYVHVPSLLRSENGELCAYVLVLLDEATNIHEYVERARSAIDAAKANGDLRLLPGERVEWGGQYDLYVAGERRFALCAPLVVLAMMGLLFLQFRNFVEAMLVMLSVPFALVGSIWALFLTGYPVSAPVWVGILSVLGLAMQTGVLMVVYIDDAFYRRVREGRLSTREDIVAAHADGTVRRLRPKLMTTATMAVSLLPLLWAEGAGSEIMQRVATPMLGGLLTSAFLTLEVLPVLYTLWRCGQLSRAHRLGLPIAAIVGTRPAWSDGDG